MKNTTYKKELDAAVAIARKAGALLLQGFRKVHRIDHKGATDLVTEMDLASEALIRREIAKLFPGDAFHGEEGGGGEIGKGRVWIADPLDGTTNYAHGLGIFSVSIALCENGEPRAGAVFQPVSQELFHARSGGGAFRNGLPIRVSPQKKMGQSLVVTGFPYVIEGCMTATLKRLRGMMRASQGVRRLGSAAMDLCYLSSGIFEVFWETDLKPWDIAAGVVILREAGGKATDFSGNPLRLDGMEILATNGVLHLPAMKALATA